MVALAAVAVAFYLTLGAGIRRHAAAPSVAQLTDAPPEPPAWTAWLDHLTAPLQPRLELDRERWRLEDEARRVVEVPPAEADARRAEFVLTTTGAGAQITYDCRCRVGERAMAATTLPKTPVAGETRVRFSILAAGGRLTLEGAGAGRHRIRLE